MNFRVKLTFKGKNVICEQINYHTAIFLENGGVVKNGLATNQIP